jgi:hypothetical protein
VDSDAVGVDVGDITPERTDDGPLVLVDVAAGVGLGDSFEVVTLVPLKVSLLRTAPAISCILPIFPNASKYRFNASPDSNNALLPCASVVIAMAS